MLPPRVTMELEAMAIKEYSAFLKAPALQSLTIRLFNVITRTLVGKSYSSTEMQSVYSPVLAGLTVGKISEKCGTKNIWCTRAPLFRYTKRAPYCYY